MALLVGDKLPGGLQTPKAAVPLVLLGLAVLVVGSVQPVEQSSASVALVESGLNGFKLELRGLVRTYADLLQMVVIVPLRTPHKGQMIAGVGRAGV